MVIKKRLQPAALAAAMLLLCGCSLMAQPEVIYVTATPGPEMNVVSVVSTPLPTLTPTPAVSPTPTIPPAQILASGDTELRNGYYEKAVEDYRAIVNQFDAPAEVRAEAAFGLGQAALREGLFQDAVDALTVLIEQFSDSPHVSQAYFLRGDAYLGLSLWSQAIADFQQYLALRPGLIDSYVYERIGDAQLALGQSAESLASYQQAITAGRTLAPLLALRERVAQIYLNAGQHNEAIAQYDAILQVAEQADYRATIELAAAQAMVASGQLEMGMARMQQLFTTYPERPEAYQAMVALVANGYEPNVVDQARVSFTYGDYQNTIRILNDYTTRTPLANVPAEVHMLLGRSYREIGNPTAAVTAFQTVISQYPRDPVFGAALLEQGRTRFLSGDIPGAIEHYISIADNYEYLPEAAEALWRAGYLYGTNDQPDQSRAIFTRLADAYPNTEQARSGLSLAASAAYSAGDTTSAEMFYGRLATSATGEDRAAAYFMAARLALARGDQRTAETAFREVVNAAPDSYYSARSQDIAAGRGAFEPAAAYSFDFDEAADRAEAEAWLRQTFNITQEGELWPLSPALNADPRMVRGRELWAVGAYDEAQDEFGDLLEAYKDDGLASYQLAIHLRDLNDYLSSIVGAANIIRAANVGTLQAPAYIARMRYPAYYVEPVVEISQQYGMDPLLLFSLIRHESLFNTIATAAAGEKGLTQVIPSTGEYIATQLQWPDYQHSDLFRPYAGISFGAYYLDEQLDRFDGNVVAALSAYNAGPGRAINWLELSGGDPDLFMTAITIDSTRTYVQRIYGFFNIYRALYS